MLLSPQTSEVTGSFFFLPPCSADLSGAGPAAAASLAVRSTQSCPEFGSYNLTSNVWALHTERQLNACLPK